MTLRKPLLSLDLVDIPLFRKGKVRNVYDLGETILFVATDRISAFDVVMQNGIPEKGRVLNMISAFWFGQTRDIVENHMVTVNIDDMVREYPVLEPYRDILDGRSMLVKKAKPVMAECVVRGYLSGSGWKDYQKTGKICGIELPQGLNESDKLPEPIFTPSTKAEVGHDINISQEQLKEEVGGKVFDFIKEKSLAIYKKACAFAEERGIIIADTKFEFGTIGKKIILMDEVLTPDSSRFWPRDEYKPGGPQKSFDKQFVRDYLDTVEWDKTPPGPELPEKIVQRTSEKYLLAYKVLTGKEL